MSEELWSAFSLGVGFALKCGLIMIVVSVVGSFVKDQLPFLIPILIAALFCLALGIILQGMGIGI